MLKAEPLKKRCRRIAVQTAVWRLFCNREILRHRRRVAVQTNIKCRVSVSPELYTVKYTHKDGWSGREEVYIYVQKRTVKVFAVCLGTCNEMQCFDRRIQKTNGSAAKKNIYLNVISCNSVIGFEGFWGTAACSCRTERPVLLIYVFLYPIYRISIKYGKSAKNCT